MLRPAEPFDVLILANGPGELSTWVRPVVQQIREAWGVDRDTVRISLVLSPCPHATGQEVRIAQRYPEIDRIQAAANFYPFLIFGKTAEPWDWRSRGLVIFLGGDQFFSIVIGKRLGYAVLIYAEWEARWWRWADHFAVMQPKAVLTVSPKLRHKFTVVGDLMAEVARSVQPCPKTAGVSIGLLPGSKAAKLRIGLPFMLAVADQVHAQFPDVKFFIPMAPTLTVDELAVYARRDQNASIAKFDGQTAELCGDGASLYLRTPKGTQVELHTDFPAYSKLSQCQLCLTTVGANTAELGALGVPMLVLLPTQQLDIMRAWDGLPGLLVNLPVVGGWIATKINKRLIQRLGLLAWPNIWAGREIVPELLGELYPTEVAIRVGEYLRHPEQLDSIRQALRAVRGEPGAAQKLVAVATQLLNIAER